MENIACARLELAFEPPSRGYARGATHLGLNNDAQRGSGGLCANGCRTQRTREVEEGVLFGHDVDVTLLSRSRGGSIGEGEGVGSRGRCCLVGHKFDIIRAKSWRANAFAKSSRTGQL